MDLNELDFNNIGRWPLAARLFAVALVFAAVLGAGFWYFTQDKIAELEIVEKKEQPLKQEFKDKQGKAANLEAYKLQMVEMEKRFGSMLRQLPQKTEVAGLLVEVSQTGLSNGLEFSLFKPSAEIRKEFYAELPVNINVAGTYHDFGGFASGLAALPRIVTIHNIVITPTKANQNKENLDIDSDKLLNITLVAKTYRYLDEDEMSATTSRKKRKKKR
jgi:type IV pilus assembly protein PilO